MVTRGREGKRSIQVIGNFIKAHADVSRVVVIQDAIVKPPELVSLLKV